MHMPLAGVQQGFLPVLLVPPPLAQTAAGLLLLYWRVFMPPLAFSNPFLPPLVCLVLLRPRARA